MEKTNTNIQENKLEWQTPDLQFILTESTEFNFMPGSDGSTPIASHS
jgi:hypothetical protein